MSSTEVVSLAKRVETVRDLFVKNKNQILMALPKHMNVDRMVRVAMTSINTTPKLLDCTPRSLLGAIIQCAQLGLEPGILGMAYLIPYENRKAGTVEVQLIPGYKGLLALARRSGDISTIMAQAVHGNDAFSYSLGTDPKITHVPTETERGVVTHYYAVGRLKDGGVQFEVMTKREVEAHRDRYSRAAKSGPWQTEFDEMAKKTVLRKLCKLLPASIELQHAVSLDERAEIQLPQDLSSLVVLDEENGHHEVGALDTLTETLAEKSA